MTQDSQPQLLYHDPHDSLELVTCELARILGITAGLGAIPLLRDRPVPFWIVEAAAGAIVIAVGGFFLARRARRQQPTTPTPGLLRRLVSSLKRLPDLLRRVLAALRRVPAFFRRMFEWLRTRLPGRHKAATVPVPAETPPSEETPKVETPVETPSASAPAPSPDRPRVLLPYLTLATGLFLFLPSILVAALQPARVPHLDQIAIYFSAPALLVWLLGEIPYLLPKIVAKPWNVPILSGVLKSALQALGAMLVFVFLALVIGQEQHPGLLYGGLGLALVGLALGYHSEAGERRRQQTRPPSLHPAEQDETAG